MNERIKFYAAQAPFSPVEFTWIDFVDIVTNDIQDEYDAFVKKQGIEHFLRQDVKDLPLPLEKIAVVIIVPNPADPSQEQGIIFTLERLTPQLIGFNMFSDPKEKVSVSLLIQDSCTRPAVVVFSDQYLKYLKHHNLDRDEIGESVGAAFERVMASVLMLGGKGSRYEYAPAYSCSGDVVKNAKRQRKGKRAFWEWKTIVVEPREVVYIHESKGGTHASPKPHERMGHWRTYKTGRRVFVRSSIVNKHKMPEEGYIFHDYIKKENNVAV